MAARRGKPAALVRASCTRLGLPKDVRVRLSSSKRSSCALRRGVSRRAGACSAQAVCARRKQDAQGSCLDCGISTSCNQATIYLKARKTGQPTPPFRRAGAVVFGGQRRPENPHSWGNSHGPRTVDTQTVSVGAGASRRKEQRPFNPSRSPTVLSRVECAWASPMESL